MSPISLALMMFFGWYGLSDFHQAPTEVCVLGGELSGISGTLIEYDEALGMYEVMQFGDKDTVIIEEEFVFIGGRCVKNK